MSNPELRGTFIQFLTRRGWAVAKEGERFDRLAAPPELGLPAEYRLAIPRNTAAVDFDAVLQRQLQLIASLYGSSVEQLRVMLAERDTIMSLRIASEDTRDGSISFQRFEVIVERIKKLLLDTASFVVTNSPRIERTPDEARFYLSRCRFMQTESGSYVANIQLPGNEFLTLPNLIDDQTVGTDAVNDRLESFLSFAMGPVMHQSSEAYDEEYLRDSADLLNVDLFRDAADLFGSVAGGELNISFRRAEQTRALDSGRLESYRVQRLRSYADFLRGYLDTEQEIELIGRIVELRSRNPDRNRNYVLVSGVYDGRQAYLAVRLSQRDYPTAIEIHRRNRLVRVAGIARRLKTQFSITKLFLFEEAFEAGA